MGIRGCGMVRDYANSAEKKYFLFSQNGDIMCNLNANASLKTM